MQLENFDYDLPEELIAQHPSERRDHSRMMVVNRRTENIIHDYFFNLPEYLKEGDVLVINDSKVIPARLIGKKETGGSIEMLLLSKKSNESVQSSTWEVLLKPAKRVQIGTRIFFENHCEAVINDRIYNKIWVITFKANMNFDRFLNQYGSAPLPPYIKRKKDTTARDIDRDRYQTIYAKAPGSVAAPTAGLHFSNDVLKALEKKGVHIASLTLHVGYGTFLPIETDHVESHVMEKEYFEISKETSDIINKAENVIAVGTTSTRAIESVTDGNGNINPSSSHSDLFIYPGYRFKRVNSLVTNFHLPKSSLFLLVCAFAGKELMHKVYLQAIEHQYRFYSYGDCMLIL